ncbi:SUKH-4 family immunity protein [Streptomyces sp. ISL-36]|uniref:nucleic acid/nucleotide deaminase domain-containing protein n=1 Tax=Streptomyces sp. ISL-36 TaxID=2819182 RepID=UPI001BE6FF42|nr:nucleic acid/nucleotide deaminase domain-containing protein [Streptomyces sp. ISL-36]MBT2439613.1 SUKH-4 family immunity protein [Streptomyces sp. ISL-36]
MSSPHPDRPDELVQHFGREGLRRFGPGSLLGARVPTAAQMLLEESGVPRSVFPYFQAPTADEPVTLGVVAARGAGPRPHAEMETWPRIGFDGLAHLCVRPDGAVQAVVLEDVTDAMFVNTDVSTLNASLLALDRAQPLLATASRLEEAAAVYGRLKTELTRIDQAAFNEREAWWPRILDDIRHTLNFPFSAAFEYVDSSGTKQVVTEATGPGQPHPEEIIWRRLSDAGVEPDQVRRVYCELEPCLMPGHYCAVWMQRAFPGAEFTHSFDYGDTAESREEGMKQLITHAAEQSRGR